MTENGVPPSGNTRTVVGQSVARRAPGVVRSKWVNNKQVQWTMKQNTWDGSNPDKELSRTHHLLFSERRTTY